VKFNDISKMLVRTIKKVGIQYRSISVFKALSDQTRSMEKEVRQTTGSEVIDSGDVPLSRQQYKSYLQECEHGDAQLFTFPKSNTKLYLISSAISSFNPKRFYQLLNKVRPDLLLLQISPFSEVKNSSIIENPEILINSSENILPSEEIYYSIRKHLLSRGMLIGEQQLPNKYNILHSHRLSKLLQALTSMWAVRNNVRIALIDIPEMTYKQIIANSLSLREFQNIFDTIAIEHGVDDKFSLYETAIRCFPDVFLFFSDKYMASVINRLINHCTRSNIKKLLLFCGCGQTRSLKDYIRREGYEYKIENCLKVPERYETLIRRETVDMLIEKIVILEVIMNNNVNERIDEEIYLSDVSQSSLEWIKEEVTKELGAENIDIRMRLFEDLIKKYLNERVEKEKIGNQRRITAMKSKILNAPPMI